MNRRISRYLVAAIISMTLMGGLRTSQQGQAQAQGNCRTFTETGKTVCDRFLEYWTQNGGLAQQGFPISDAKAEKNDTDGKTYLTQYFERAVFELHPENRRPFDVLLSLLGVFEYKNRYGTAGAPGQTPSADNPFKFNETGKTVGGKFRSYWTQNGGLSQQGFPISEEFQEKSNLDGKTYTVQYFERAVFELHPENQPPYDVLLSQLGTFRYKQQQRSVLAGTIKIAAEISMSGLEAADGIPTSNGMKLAIDQANAKGGVTFPNGKRYNLEMSLLDEVPPGGQAHDPAQGSKNADTFIADPDVIVMLGPFFSSVASAMMPKMNVAGLCNISPSNTNETLTKPQYGRTDIYRPTGKVTYFRVSSTDDLQGPATADYVFDTLGLRKAYILDDSDAYGKELSDGFGAEFRRKGGTVLGHEGVPVGTTDYSSILGGIAAQGPDFLYYGGVSANNIPLARKQMRAVGLNIPLVGGDGIVDNEYLRVAGADAEGSYGSWSSVHVQALPEAAQFVTDYKAAFGNEPGDYSGPGYEAANIAIDAIKRGGAKDRAAVCQALRDTRNYKGILGDTSFDENGDTTNQIFSFYAVRNGRWQWVDQLRFTGR